MNAQRKADMARLQQMIASGRTEPNADDLCFIRVIMNDPARLPTATADRLRPLVAKWL